MEAEPAYSSLDTEEEVAVFRGLCDPQLVSKRERDEHERTHLPYRDWSSTPSSSQAKIQRREGEHRQVPRIAMDYFLMSEKDKAEDANPLFVMIDEENSDKYSRVVEKQGLGDNGEMDWLVKDISDELKAWGGEGHQSILKSDGEWPIRALKEAVGKYHGGIVMMEVSARG